MDKLGNWVVAPKKIFGQIGKLGRSINPQNGAILEVTTTSLNAWWKSAKKVQHASSKFHVETDHDQILVVLENLPND